MPDLIPINVIAQNGDEFAVLLPAVPAKGAALAILSEDEKRIAHGRVAYVEWRILPARTAITLMLED
jgi:hypothetical protein